jgi:hypothetical protein
MRPAEQRRVVDRQDGAAATRQAGSADAEALNFAGSPRRGRDIIGAGRGHSVDLEAGASDRMGGMAQCLFVVVAWTEAVAMRPSNWFGN